MSEERKLVGFDADGNECEPHPAIRRYRYGPWHIELDRSSLMPTNDWVWSHDDFDGADDANDSRCGRSGSLTACIADIDDLENGA